jgi:hypothetical protein
MAFTVEINKDEKEQFLKIMDLYPDRMYVIGSNTEEAYHLIFLGEDMERDCLLQETLMEHLDYVKIEENIGG